MRKKRIKRVALVNVSCGGSILVELILRENDQQKGFHGFSRSQDPTAVISRVEIPQRSSLSKHWGCAILSVGRTGGTE